MDYSKFEAALKEAYNKVCVNCAYSKDYYGSGPICYDGAPDVAPELCEKFKNAVKECLDTP